MPFVPCQPDRTILGYICFQIWPYESKVKVMGGVKGKYHSVSYIG